MHEPHVRFGFGWPFARGARLCIPHRGCLTPAQSISICSPGLRWIRIVAPVDFIHHRYCSLKNEY